jgi:excinuclease ABC subunit B
LEAKRLEERTNFDLEMIRELGLLELKIIPVIWMEDYRTRPFCLLDYFQKISYWWWTKAT